MNILAFDTSSPACSVALYSDVNQAGGETFSVHEIAPMQHTSIVLPMIQSLLDSAGITMASLDAIAFGCGPGSFTGIRIAASLAQGLAYANSLPVIPVSSMAAAAEAAYLAWGWERLLVSFDARMGEVYWGGYQIEDELATPVFPEQLAAPHSVHTPPAGEWYGVGDGWKSYANELTSHIEGKLLQVDVECVPSAEAVLKLAVDRFQRGEWVDASEALPVYLR